MFIAVLLFIYNSQDMRQPSYLSTNEWIKIPLSREGFLEVAFFPTLHDKVCWNNATTSKNRQFRERKLPLKRKINATTQYCTNQVTSDTARLLCGMSAAGVGTQVGCTTQEQQGDTRLHRHYGGFDPARSPREGVQQRR